MNAPQKLAKDEQQMKTLREEYKCRSKEEACKEIIAIERDIDLLQKKIAKGYEIRANLLLILNKILEGEHNDGTNG